MESPQKMAPQGQEKQSEWEEFVGLLDKEAQAKGGELRVYSIFDEQGNVRANARKVMVFPADSLDTANLSPAFDGQYVLRVMTTTQMGNMKDGVLINAGQEPRADKAYVFRLADDGVTLRDRALLSCYYNPDRNRWEMSPN